ncbi:hypothetical protein H4R21_001540 [Coemansia helicoidea]|uniref:Uncharacterized protein n=1 Tax=Coemansia helicoidea TaxID=1286919 RepID=A0ACC1LBG3_9FUNG|nr:hypothetical protein H4R21_001540 [Coemansia helicoidea]
MSRKALKKLRSLGVNVHLNERIDIPSDEPLTNKLECRWLKTSKGRSIFSNVQFLCNGITFSTTFMDSLDPAAKADIIDARTGQIRVLPTMQINHPELPWIFAAGDVCDTEGEKQAYRADSQGGHVAQCMARMAEAWCQGDSRWFKAPLKNWQDPAQYMSVPLGPDGGVTDTPWIVLGDLPTRIMKSRELFLARRYKEFNLEFPGVIKSVRGSISTGSAAANPTLTPPPSNTLNGCAATDASRLSRELSKPLANMALAAASRLDDKFESDRISLSRPALLATPSPSPNPSPIPSTTPSTNFRRDATPAARSTGYPYYDFRRSRRSPTVHGSESSDDCSSDEESSIYMGSCAPTSVYIQATPCTHCGHVNYSQIAFTSSVSVSSRSSKASISTAAPKTPATAMPFMREMPSAMHSGPVLPRKEKPPVSAAMMPPPSHKSHKSSSSHGGPSSHSTATIYLEQYQQV